LAIPFELKVIEKWRHRRCRGQARSIAAINCGESAIVSVRWLIATHCPQEGQRLGDFDAAIHAFQQVGLRLSKAETKTFVSKTAHSRPVTEPVSIDGGSQGNSLSADLLGQGFKPGGYLRALDVAQQGGLPAGFGYNLSRRPATGAARQAGAAVADEQRAAPPSQCLPPAIAAT
jgi:hypothetical protein